AAVQLGLIPGTPVAAGLIDAHAGGVGTVGARSEPGNLLTRMAYVFGTSACTMSSTNEGAFVPGVWGPYFSAMVPGLWLNEGGQSATGALIDHTIFSHARGAELAAEAKQKETTVYALLNARIEALAQSAPFPAALTRELHVLP